MTNTTDGRFRRGRKAVGPWAAATDVRKRNRRIKEAKQRAREHAKGKA